MFLILSCYDRLDRRATMGTVINIKDYLDKGSWQEVFEHDDGYTEAHVYVCPRTSEIEITQISDGKSNRTVLTPVDAARLLAALTKAFV